MNDYIFRTITLMVVDLVWEHWATSANDGLAGDGYISWGKTQETIEDLKKLGFTTATELAAQVEEAARRIYLKQVEAHKIGVANRDITRLAAEAHVHEILGWYI